MARPLTRSQWQKRKGGFKTYTRYVQWWRGQATARNTRFAAGVATPQEISRLAAQSAADAIRPERLALEAQAARAEARARTRSQDIQGFGLAAGQMLQGAGPQVNQMWGAAADRTSAYARGMAEGQNMASQGAAGEANALLAQHGAPTQQQATGAQGEVLFGLGTLPAGTLAAQGAAFGSAASFLPSSALGRGQQDIRGAQRTAEEEQAKYDEQLAALQAKRPSLIGDITRQLQSDQTQRQSIQTQNAYLQASLRRTGADITGIDPATGLPSYEAQSDAAQAAADAAEAEAEAVAEAGKTAKERAEDRRKALGNRATALTVASKLVRTNAPDWQGKPIENPKPASLLNPGKYIDKRGRGTDDLNKAAREGALTYSQAFAQAMALEEVQQLMSRYGYSKTQARAKVRAWLRAAGITPGPTRKRPRISQGARNSPH
jgi:hypothetical protein